MRVNTGVLRTGGNESRRAGDHAQDAAGHLARGPLAAGMFGDFAAADAFHETMSSAHADHVKALKGHHDALNHVSAKTHHAADSFDAMDDRNKEALRSVY